MTYQCLHVKAAQIAIDDQLFHEVDAKSHDTLKDFYLTGKKRKK